MVSYIRTGTAGTLSPYLSSIALSFVRSKGHAERVQVQVNKDYFERIETSCSFAGSRLHDIHVLKTERQDRVVGLRAEGPLHELAGAVFLPISQERPLHPSDDRVDIPVGPDQLAGR